MPLFSTVTRKGTSSSCVFYISSLQWSKNSCAFLGLVFGLFIYFIFCPAACRENGEGIKQTTQSSEECRLSAMLQNVNHCSMFSNLDFAKVTLKTLMLFAVFTAKTADVLLGY